MTEHDKVVCGPSIEPLKEMCKSYCGDIGDVYAIREAIAAYDELKAELDESNHWRERHSKDAEAYGKQSQRNWEQLQAHKDALKKAKCALQNISDWSDNPSGCEYNDEEVKQALSAIKALNP